eukprot:NODE_6264_length_555_cov_14.030374_g6099_i0.p1 GENE.NODE_6264_length_555_cov_14.030374_g6099_i0~~NODE_6264_length_555_cov_14.030374_g6099_i0.p1  ORF type:complete len:151 (-),score=19.81 NODE_6264_length_555_cov_14.030374_g6099_i0:103-504(-)
MGLLKDTYPHPVSSRKVNWKQPIGQGKALMAEGTRALREGSLGGMQPHASGGHFFHYYPSQDLDLVPVYRGLQQSLPPAHERVVDRREHYPDLAGLPPSASMAPPTPFAHGYQLPPSTPLHGVMEAAPMYLIQ